MSIIDFLPNELLDMVFLENAANFSRLAPRLHFKTTRACSQVCSRWRRLILGRPSLWAPLLDFSMSDEWITTILARAGPNSKLELVIPSLTPIYEYYLVTPSVRHEFDYYLGTVSAPIELVKENAMMDLFKHPGKISVKDLTIFQRCHTLALVLHAAHWENHYKLIKQQLPQMENITLGCMGSNSEDGYFITRIQSSVPWRARTLHLWKVFLPLSIPVFQSLEHLKISACRWHHRYTAMGWLQILEGMPNLRSLDLGNGVIDERMLSSTDVRRVEPMSPSSESKIPLRHLETFTFTCTAADATLLLSRLDLPKICSIRPCIHMSRRDLSFKTLCTVLEQLQSAWSSEDCDTVSISLDPTYCHVEVGHHKWNDQKDDLANTRLDIVFMYLPHYTSDPAMRFKPNEPLIELLTSLRKTCERASRVVLRTIKDIDFPVGLIHSLFTRATTLFIPSITPLLVKILAPPVKKVASIDVEDDEDKENAPPAGHAPALPTKKLFPQLTSIEYISLSLHAKLDAFDALGISIVHLKNPANY